MIAEVVPALSLPRTLSVFDYLVPASLATTVAPGQIVRVPFRRRLVRGVIWRLQTKTTNTPYRLRSLISTDRAAPAFSDEQRSFVEWVARRSAVSPALIVKSFIRLIDQHSIPSRPASPVPAGAGLPTTLAGLPDGLTLGLYDRLAARDALLDELIEGVQAGPVAIVVPERRRLESLKSKLPRETPVISSDEPVGQLRKSLARLGQSSLIVGNRSLLLTPLPRLRLIVIDDEDNEQHKQRDQQPHFSSLILALEWARRFHCPVLALSTAPSLTAYGYVRADLRRIVRLGANDPPRIKLLDLTSKTFRRSRFFRQDVINEMATLLQQRKRVFIFLNRRGLARMLVCTECGWVATCRQCGTAQMRHPEGLRCSVCARTDTAPTNCPNCQGTRLDHLFPGTASLERQLAQHFRGSVARVDRDHPALPAPPPPVLVGTEFALPFLSAFAPHHATVLGTDHLFLLPSSRALERGFQLLRRIASVDSLETMTIETRYPKHLLFQSFANHAVTDFLEHEWRMRLRYRLPPAVPGVTFESRLGNAAVAELRQWLTSVGQNPQQLRGPVDGRRGRQSVIRFHLEGSVEDLFPGTQLASLPESWIFDPDPWD